MSERRVVITGLGMLTPLATNVVDTWRKILAGESGIRTIDTFSTDDITTKFAGLVPAFSSAHLISAKDEKKIDDFVKYGLVAASEAMLDSGLEVNDANRTRIGVAIGSGIGGIPMIENNADALATKGPRRISPFFIPGTIINMVAGYISIHYGLQGPNISIVTACTTGSHNIGYAARTIAYGDADVMLAGGTEKASCRLGLGGFASMRALSTRNDAPELASRPWDKDRDGFVLADGAGVLVLEEYEHAKKRGAKIYAELVGFGMSADAHHMTSNDQTGAAPALGMNNSLKDAGINASDVQYLNAHATSTSVGDPAEIKAIKLSFGEHAYQMAVSSTKSMTGHLLGAAGAIEAIFTVLSLRDQVSPPTINLDNPDLEAGCDLNFVPNIAQEMKINYAMSNSFGFGGTNGSLVFKKS
jgi:3-oxoacyl-[acyl-carrier-protein] synthase II